MNLQKFTILLFASLFALGAAYSVFYSSNNFNSACAAANEHVATFQDDFEKFANNQALIDKILSNELTDAELQMIVNSYPFIYIYQDNKLIFWNTNATIPEAQIDNISAEGSLLLQKNGYYIGIRKAFNNYQIIGLQLIRHNYPIANKYLSNDFVYPYSFKSDTKINPASSDIGKAIVNKKGSTLFKLEYENSPSKQINFIPLVVGYLSLVFYWLMTLNLAKYVKKKFNLKYAFLLMLVMSILFDLIIEFVDFEFKHSILFSPELYASQYYGNSLGDLLLHTLVFLFVSGFAVYFFYYQRWKLSKTSFGVYTVFVFLSFLLYNLVIKSLILDSVISFELNNITQTSIYTLVGMFIIAFVSFNALIYLYIWVLSALDLLQSKSYFGVLLFFTLAGIVLYFWNFKLIAFLCPLLFSILSLSNFFILLNRKSFERSNYILLNLFFISLITGTLLSFYNLNKEDARKATIANQVSENHDLITEYRFELIQKDIKADPFFKKFFVSPFISLKDVQQRLTYVYFNGYLSKYNVNSIAFNIEGKAIKTADSTTLSTYYELINKDAEDTFSEWLFLIPKDNGKHNYLSILPIENDGVVNGTLVIELSPKTYHKENLYPELLIEQQTNPVTDFTIKKEYDYGIYKNNYLISQTGEFPFPYFFGVFNAQSEFPFVEKTKKFRLNFFEIDNETKVVMSSPKISALIPISTFSYIFCFLGILILVIYLIIQFLIFRTNKSNTLGLNFTFKNRISFAITSITIASLIVVGLVTIGYFSQLYKVNNTDTLIKKQKQVLSSLEYFLEKQFVVDDNKLPQNLATEIASLAEIHGIDINLFSLEGNLLLSSQPGVFGNGLVSKVINPLAKYNLGDLRAERFIMNEAIGNLTYQSVYVPLRAKNGQAIAFLNLPYFAQKETLRTELSNLMVALVNVYVLLLMFSIFLAYLVSKSITSPLASISKKFGQVNLDAKNEAITWDSDDEIGALVKEYNKMIKQIEESASTLAQSERESAWREMARQIAHEIKNPLTPMKLSIQHLQRAIKERPDEVNELATKVSKTMIEQIENLAEIATAFSSFAKMPTANKEIINLKEVLQNVVDLFSQNSELIIEFNCEFNEAIIYADKNQLLSVFNNLVKNALQATEEKPNAKIKVSIEKEGITFKVKIEDNGVGIPEDKKNKVFVPNFTTKSSGTGLGLAISKQIIENHHGAIYFESEENKGTTFYVTLPQYTEK